MQILIKLRAQFIQSLTIDEHYFHYIYCKLLAFILKCFLLSKAYKIKYILKTNLKNQIYRSRTINSFRYPASNNKNNVKSNKMYSLDTHLKIQLQRTFNSVIFVSWLIINYSLKSKFKLSLILSGDHQFDRVTNSAEINKITAAEMYV